MTTNRWRIPLFDLNFNQEEEDAVVAVLRSKWLSMGPATEAFESAMADYLGARHAIAVANGTCALQLAYLAAVRHLDRPASETTVKVPDITFVATANAAYAAGCNIQLADIQGPRNPRLKFAADDRPSQIAGLVHYAGFDAFGDLGSSIPSEVLIIEDAAHAIGTRNSQGKFLGTLGFAGCISFFSNKNLATGEGGMVVTNDDDAARHIRLLRSHGMTSLTWERHQRGPSSYDVLHPGHNFRCTEITAALGLQQLEKLDDANQKRRSLYRRYGQLLSAQASLNIPYMEDLDRYQPACHILPLICETTALRDGIRQKLAANSIQTSHHYPPISSFTWYKSAPDRITKSSDLSASRAWSDHQTTLPLYPDMKLDHVDEICALILEVALAFEQAKVRGSLS